MSDLSDEYLLRWLSKWPHPADLHLWAQKPPFVTPTMPNYITFINSCPSLDIGSVGCMLTKMAVQMALSYSFTFVGTKAVICHFNNAYKDGCHKRCRRSIITCVK